jgi:hypothetical protein
MNQLANEIDKLISGKKESDEYMRFVNHIFRDCLLVDNENPIWNFLLCMKQKQET